MLTELCYFRHHRNKYWRHKKPSAAASFLRPRHKKPSAAASFLRPRLRKLGCPTHILKCQIHSASHRLPPQWPQLHQCRNRWRTTSVPASGRALITHTIRVFVAHRGKFPVRRSQVLVVLVCCQRRRAAQPLTPLGTVPANCFVMHLVEDLLRSRLTLGTCGVISQYIYLNSTSYYSL